MYLGKVVLVTGGLGFMGSNFILHLMKRYQNIAVVNLDAMTYAADQARLSSIQDEPNYHFIHGDIRDEALLFEVFETYKIDTVVHFAAESHVDRSIENARDFTLTNVFGTFTLLEACRRQQQKVHFHHISTDEVYGDIVEGLFSEASPYRPSSPYAASKAASDHFVLSYARTYGLSVTMSHSCNNFGPYQDQEKLIPKAVHNFIDDLTVPLYGDGQQVREWLHVDDHSRAILIILEKGKAGVYNVGSGSRLSNSEVLDCIIEVVSAKVARNSDKLYDLIQRVEDRAGHDVRYALDSSKIQALGFRPSKTFLVAIESMIEEIVCLKL
jgi:dTDP-glucose 4,6-dehydratase